MPDYDIHRFKYCTMYSVNLSIQETHHEMRIQKRDVTVIVLSLYLLRLIHRQPLNRKQQISHWTLTRLRRIYTVHWCTDCGSLLGPLYTNYRVTSYLRLLALSIQTYRPNMSFLVRLISGISIRLENFSWGTAFSTPQPLLRKKNLHGIWVLVHSYLRLRSTFLAPIT